ncbi:GLPGLI family protein [Empedobacter brevis]|uniref:GLPGLI family protein n=1 Tax=Empedobacter brevis TaxID=247 RepID=UPI0039B086C6
MKTLFTLLSYCTIFSGIVFAQKLEVMYQETLKVNPDEYKSSVKYSADGKESTIPNDIFSELLKSVTEPKNYLLTIYNHETSYKKIEKLNNKQVNSSFYFDGSGTTKDLFKNLTTKEYFRNVRVMGKPYIIKDKLKEYKWSLTRDSKKIIGFDVKKATAVIDSTTTVTAWYAPSIAVKDGPSMFNGLPGLILELDIKNTKRKGIESHTISAIEVKEVPTVKPFDKPKDKNIITNDEYKALNKKELEHYKKMTSEGVSKD